MWSTKDPGKVKNWSASGGIGRVVYIQALIHPNQTSNSDNHCFPLNWLKAAIDERHLKLAN